MGLSVALFLPDLEELFQLFQGANALVKALSRQDRELDLGDVEPTPVLGRVMDLELVTTGRVKIPPSPLRRRGRVLAAPLRILECVFKLSITMTIFEASR